MPRDGVWKMLFHTPSLVTSRWKPADASEIKALWMIFSQRLNLFKENTKNNEFDLYIPSRYNEGIRKI